MARNLPASDSQRKAGVVPRVTTPCTGKAAGIKFLLAMRHKALILLVEDRADDVTIILRSFDKAGITNPTCVVGDGEEAIAYLSGSGKYANRNEYPLPELILLDLKMPKVDGFEVLKWVRTHPELSNIRVVVLTSSDDIRDVNLAYKLGANSFLVKPMDFNHYVELGNFIADNWFLWNEEQGSRRPPHGADWATKNKRVLLRDRHSHKFYAGRAAWSDNKRDAVDFEHIDLAEAVAAAEHLKTAEIVLAYDEPGCELTLPVVFPGVRRS
jgi:CheY-like chemotaxis protein